MPHPLVTQLRFARSEFVRCLEGVSPEDGIARIVPMNCIICGQCGGKSPQPPTLTWTP